MTVYIVWRNYCIDKIFSSLDNANFYISQLKKENTNEYICTEEHRVD